MPFLFLFGCLALPCWLSGWLTWLAGRLARSQTVNSVLAIKRFSRSGPMPKDAWIGLFAIIRRTSICTAACARRIGHDWLACCIP
ncbi:hypothetical protein F4778DRAFT_726470 [Xylariomycetidae sp. FL2044]|nr:hypothetical protein F4778DRAFT_726470 [Xylariomycetidae sp. FL2044]